MRVVIDTNVLVSAIFWGGSPDKILKAWNAGKLELVVTEEIVNEYDRVVRYIAKKRKQEEVADLVLSLIGTKALLRKSAKLPTQICDDASDDKFIAAALGGNAQAIITGDKALLRARVPGVRVLKPAEFLKQI